MRSYLVFPKNYKRNGGVETQNIRYMPQIIELQNVSYKYNGADDYSLRNVSLRITPGEHLAIVGLNGAGKTTLVKLICGLIDPTEGRVLYEGIDVREYNRTEYYKLFSAVFQQFSIMPLSIEEIIAEVPRDKIDPGRIESCLKQAGLSKKIASLPKGIKSEFGKTVHDGGVEFSSGEAQKIALARALYKGEPFMILDEPTAALDPIAEAEVYSKFNEIVGGKTAIYISHCLSSCRFCDNITVFD